MPLAIATPLASASSSVAPFTTCVMEDFFFGCSSSFCGSSSGSSSGFSSAGSSSSSSTASSSDSSSESSMLFSISSTACARLTAETGLDTSSSVSAADSSGSSVSATDSSGSSVSSTASSAASTASSACTGFAVGFFGAPGLLSYFSCCSGVNGLYFIFNSIAL